MSESFGALTGAIIRAKMPGEKTKQNELDRATLLALAASSEEVGGPVVLSLAALTRRCRIVDDRVTKASVARLIEAGLLIVVGQDVALVPAAVTSMPRDPMWSWGGHGGLGRCAGYQTPARKGCAAPHNGVQGTGCEEHRNNGATFAAPHDGVQGTLDRGARNPIIGCEEPHDRVRRTPPIYLSPSGPNSDPLLDPPQPLPPTPHGQDEEEGQEGEFLTFPGDDVPLPTDADLALWGELVEAHAVDFFADSEPATVARPAVPSKPAQIETLPITGHDPLAVRLAADFERLTSAPLAPPADHDAVALRAEVEGLLAPIVSKRGGFGLSPIHRELLDRILADHRKATGVDELGALKALRERLPESSDKTSPLSWLAVVMKGPRKPQETLNGGDRYPRQGGGGYGAQEAPRAPDDRRLSKFAQWYYDRYECAWDPLHMLDGAKWAILRETEPGAEEMIRKRLEDKANGIENPYPEPKEVNNG